MSENYVAEELQEGSLAAENGGQFTPVSAGSERGEEVSVFVEPVDQVDALHSVQEDDSKVSEDVGREDMFVDCSEEIETSETPKISDGKDIVQDVPFNELNNDTQVQDMMAEMENLRDKLEKAVAEKHGASQEYEEQKATVKRELAHLYCQIKALKVKQSSLNENNCVGDKEEKNLESETSLHDMINECSKFLEDALGWQSQAECSIRDLQAALQMKDSEIEDLYLKVAEFSASNMEEIANRILASLPMAVHEEGMFDESIRQKYSRIEDGISLLIGKYNQFLSEIDQLRWCLTEIAPEISVEDEVGILSSARNKLLEFKKMEVGLDQKLSHFESENAKQLEELDKNKAIIENANTEIAKIKAELEQEKTKYANTKEKLSMAVTKGKALVQQRDSLKQALADKTSELEKCLNELQDKSIALESAEQSRDLLLRSKDLAASLQDSLTQKGLTLQKCGEILSEASGSEEIKSSEVIEKLVELKDERNALKSLALEFHKFSDVLSSISFPGNVPSNELDTQLKWLVESFHVAKEEALKLQDEIAGIQEAASREIDCITTSFLAGMQEKDYLQEELEDLRSKYEGIVEKENQVASEKAQMVNMLLRASGVIVDGQEEVNFSQPGMAGILDKCIVKIKEEAGESLKSSEVKEEVFERLKSLLYVRDQELMLYMHLLEEEMLDRGEMNRLSNELAVLTSELGRLKDEKDSLQKELGRSDEKSVLLREKLSMAVKKGKGLVQERENLKGTIDGKNAEIVKLRSELQEQVAASNDLKDQINKLLGDIDHIHKLEADLGATEEQRNQLEQLLVESSNMLQQLIESLDGINLPADLVFKDPAEKIKWLAGYLSECQAAEAQSQQELEIVKHEANTLASRILEAETAMKSMENALTEAEDKISQLREEKRELEGAKIQAEQELQRAVEEVCSLKSKFAEVSETVKSHENALVLAEENVSKLVNQKEDALVSKAAVEMELQKLKEENTIYVSRLADADKTIQSLEDAFSQAQKSFSLLSEENDKAQIGRNDMEDELKKLKAETHFQASKLSDASMTIKSLEDELANAENNISNLSKDNESAKQEISALNSKLSTCLQELAGTHDSIANRSVELTDEFTSLQLLLKDDTLSSIVQQSVKKKIQSLKDMDLLLREMSDYFLDIDSEVLRNFPVMEDDCSVPTLLPADLNSILNVEIVNGDVNVAVDITSHIQRTAEQFRLREKTLADRIDRFSQFMDNLMSALLKRLWIMKDGVKVTLDLMKSLKQKVIDIEKDRQRHDSTISILEKDIETLFFACTNATRELESDFQSNISGLSSIPVGGYLNESFSMELGTISEDALVDHQLVIDGSKYVQTAENLLAAARHTQHLGKLFHDIKNMMVTRIEDLENELKETKITCKKYLEESDLNQHQISKLETHLGALQNLCNDMKVKVEDYEAREAVLKEREAKLSSVLAASEAQINESQDFPLSVSQMRSLFDKINEIDISLVESEVNDWENHDSTDVRKLFYVIDKFTELQRQINSEVQERQHLQSTLEKQVFEIQHLKEKVAELDRDKQESERMKNELALGLEDIIQKFGGDQLVKVQKAAHVTGLLPILEKMVMTTIAESENLKSKSEELSIKLLGTQKVVDDLSIKVKLLEDSGHAVVNASESVKEKGVFEISTSSTQSEISETQDVVPIGKSIAVSSVPSAAHARTLRKGSSDHLAINIDPESERLVNNGPDDEDKGHVFKPLNTSGLIPRQGKMVADRIDGIWVSGGRALMSRPRARLGLIVYSVFLHLWLLGSIL